MKPRGGGGGTNGWCEGNKIVECSAKFFKEVECVHSFKKALIDFYASFQFSLLYFYCLITSHSQLLIVLFAVVFLIVIVRIILCIFSIVIINFL